MINALSKDRFAPATLPQREPKVEKSSEIEKDELTVITVGRTSIPKRDVGSFRVGPSREWRRSFCY